MKRLMAFILISITLLSFSGCVSLDDMINGNKESETKDHAHILNESSQLNTEHNFTGRILEKLEGESYLMEVTDVGNGNFAVGNEVVVNSGMLSNFQIGDMLNIQFDGKVTMSIPPQVVNVLEVTLIRSTKEN